VADIADRGAALEEQQRQWAIDGALQQVSEEPLLDDAGNRICLDCGELIPEGRMIANPKAVRCVPCQEIHEGEM